MDSLVMEGIIYWLCVRVSGSTVHSRDFREPVPVLYCANIELPQPCFLGPPCVHVWVVCVVYQ